MEYFLFKYLEKNFQYYIHKLLFKFYINYIYLINLKKNK